MELKEFYTTAELAEILGISRVAVFNKIKKGEIKALKMGRNFVIFKKDIGDIENFLSNLFKLAKEWVAFEKEFPELVTTWGNESYRAVDYGRLTAVLLEAVKELDAENQELKQRVEDLEAKA